MTKEKMQELRVRDFPVNRKQKLKELVAKVRAQGFEYHRYKMRHALIDAIDIAYKLLMPHQDVSKHVTKPDIDDEQT